MRWESGEFDRTKAHKVFHPFMPAHAANNLHEVDLDWLWAQGKRLILLDVDHTIVKWKAEEFAEEILDWITRAKSMGFEFCILSNTRRPARLKRLSVALEIETVRGRFKPSREMYRLALIKFKRKTEEAVMIGDQLMTDILGANRAGIEAIWVRKMEGKEFAGTLINRLIESFFKSIIYRALIVAPDALPGPEDVESAIPVVERTIVKQIIRFGIVGGVSFLIDYGLTLVLMGWFGATLGNWLRLSIPSLFAGSKDAAGAAAPVLGGLASLVAMFNSFVWNRIWTFEQRGKGERLAHLRRFYVVSILGSFINALIFGQMVNVLAGSDHRRITIAKIVSALLVAIWNFLGQRYYAFRPEKK